jgi:uncharacterized protein DUF4912
MTDKQYFPVPLAHLTSPFVPPGPPPEPPPAVEPERPREPEQSTEPFGMLDLEEPSETYSEDEITLMARDPFTLYIHWESTAGGRAAAGERLGGEGGLVLRLIVPGGPIIDESLPRDFGRGYLPAPHPGAVVVAVMGLRAGDGRFEPIASAAPLRVPYHEPEEGPVEWLEIPPARTRGREIERPVPARKGPAGELLGAARAAPSPTAWMGGTPGAAAPVTWPQQPATSPTSPAGGPRTRR